MTIGFLRNGRNAILKKKPIEELLVSHAILVEIFLLGCSSAEPISASSNSLKIINSFGVILFAKLVKMKSGLPYKISKYETRIINSNS